MAIPKGYFNKPVMRTTGVILILLLLAFFYMNHFNFSKNYEKYKLCCNEKQDCTNPKYYCKDKTVFNSLIDCEAFDKFKCSNGICDIPTIPQGKCIYSYQGKTYDQYFLLLYFIILTIGLFINHRIWKNGKSKINSN